MKDMCPWVGLRSGSSTGQGRLCRGVRRLCPAQRPMSLLRVMGRGWRVSTSEVGRVRGRSQSAQQEPVVLPLLRQAQAPRRHSQPRPQLASLSSSHGGPHRDRSAGFTYKRLPCEKLMQ